MRKKIIVAVTGGIAAYKSADIISALISLNHDVKVISTENALNFVTSNVLNVISKGNYLTETPGETKHIELAKWCDVFVVVPATANTIAKFAHGIADNFLTSTFLALHDDTCKIICPAMNTHMWENKITTENLKKLKTLTNNHIIDPVKGLLACGDIGMGKLASTKTIVEQIDDIIQEFPVWNFPLHLPVLGITEDSFSYLDYDWTKYVQIPTNYHVGAFGVRRKHDVHKGIDLYAKYGELVYPVENGIIVDICPFTGEIAGIPWWENTYGVYVKGKSGIVVYGEIEPNSNLKIGDFITINDVIGRVLKVLKKDNGRPQTMLHLELHEHNYIHTNQWNISEQKPEGVLNPTKYLIKSNKI
jgi:hypothetical protein